MDFVNQIPIKIMPNDFISVQDVHAKWFSTALLKWYFRIDDSSAEEIVDEYVKHLVAANKAKKDELLNSFK